MMQPQAAHTNRAAALRIAGAVALALSTLLIAVAVVRPDMMGMMMRPMHAMLGWFG